MNASIGRAAVRRNLRAAKRRGGFTLVEAAMGLAIVGIAGASVLLTTTDAIKTNDDAIQRQIANGLAQTILDELSGMRYMESGSNAYDTFLGPGSPEVAAGGRILFDDIDDYNGVRSQPSGDRWGIALGSENGDGTARHAAFQTSATYFSRWQTQVDVFYVQSSALNAPLASGVTSDYRTARVKVIYNDPLVGAIELVNLTRTFAYVPAP